jgi:hypothetical protein
MGTLTILVTHLDADRVHETVELLRLVTAEQRLMVCHAGKRKNFDQIDFDDKIFIEDPSLRGRERSLQSWNEIFEAAWWTRVQSDESLESVYLIEYDHLILDPSFERRLAGLAASTSADFLGKNCVDRTATNWQHYVRFRRDPQLLAHLRKVSVREDPERMFGCLGDGMWLSRRALQAYVETGGHPPCYCETYVPTLLHHLGFRVVDVDAHSDLYRHVRWQPSYEAGQVLELVEQDALFLHPVKDRAVVRDLVVRLGALEAARPQMRQGRAT